jgi:hypothetical protein
MFAVSIQRWTLVVAVAAVAALGACSSKGSGTSGDGDSTLDVDNCTLLTNAEVSDFAGKQLSAGEDSPLGCPYTAAGEVVADFSIRSYRQGGDAAAAAATLAPTLRVIELTSIGDEAVALADSDDSVNFLIARKGNLFVELVMTFLDVTPDSPALQKAGQLASTALGRLVAKA